MQRVINIAHRGASGTRPENTLVAFRRAMEIGADMIELDLRATADGAAVVMHDATVDRTTDGSGPVSQLTLEQFQALDAGSWFSPEFAGERAPSLAEVISLTAGKIGLNLELKATGTEEQAVAAVRQCDAGRSFISSFRVECVARVRELDPEIRTALLVRIDPPGGEEIRELIARVRELGADIAAVSFRGITRPLIEAATAAGIRVNAWTVNDPGDMRRMIELGVSGMTTNYPEKLKELLGA